jgi:hypothetical protein
MVELRVRVPASLKRWLSVQARDSGLSTARLVRLRLEQLHAEAIAAGLDDEEGAA